MPVVLQVAANYFTVVIFLNAFGFSHFQKDYNAQWVLIARSIMLTELIFAAFNFLHKSCMLHCIMFVIHLTSH